MINPALYDMTAIFCTAITFNWLLPYRRHPASLAKRPCPESVTGCEPILHEDFVYALNQIDAFMYVSEQYLARIYELATKHRTGDHFQDSPPEIISNE